MTAYFNTYYNARRLFDEAEQEVWLLPETKDTGGNLLTPINITASTKAKFTSVIEKCSKLLQYHPDSKLVDDALFMIGKSFYYQNEFQRAERKFNELLDGYPESDFFLRAKILIAYSHYKMNQKDRAQQVATEVLDLATKGDEDESIAEAALVLGQMALDVRNFAEARTYYQKVAENSGLAGARSQAWLKVGEISAGLEDFVSAEAAYRRAESASDNYIGEYRGRVGAARMIVRQGNYDEGLSKLEDLRGNTNYREFFGEIDLEIGDAFRRSGDVNAALEQYRYIDTAYARSRFSAKSYYQRGLIYETQYGLLDSALTAYARGRTEFGPDSVTFELNRRADYLTKYLAFSKDVKRLDSLLAAALLPPDTTHKAPALLRTDSLELTKTDSLAHDSTRAQLQDSMSRASAAQPSMPIDTIRSKLAITIDGLANLFFTTMNLPDSAAHWYFRLATEFPQSPQVSRALFTLAQVARADSAAFPGRVDSLYHEIIDRFPTSPFADEARRLLGLPAVTKAKDAAEASYARGTALMQSGKPLVAIDTLKALVRGFPESPVRPKAQYAIGWLYENQTRLGDSALAAYDLLVRLYPSSEYSSRVQPKLAAVQAAKLEAAQKARQDSLAAHKPAADSLATPGTADEKIEGKVQKPVGETPEDPEIRRPPRKGAEEQKKPPPSQLPDQLKDAPK